MCLCVCVCACLCVCVLYGAVISTTLHCPHTSLSSVRVQPDLTEFHEMDTDPWDTKSVSVSWNLPYTWVMDDVFSMMVSRNCFLYVPTALY